jgi:hypothetical protein
MTECLEYYYFVKLGTTARVNHKKDIKLIINLLIIYALNHVKIWYTSCRSRFKEKVSSTENLSNWWSVIES